MNPEDAVRAHLDVAEADSGLLVPIHWATFRLAPHPWSEPVERLLAAADAGGRSGSGAQAWPACRSRHGIGRSTRGGSYNRASVQAVKTPGQGRRRHSVAAGGWLRLREPAEPTAPPPTQRSPTCPRRWCPRWPFPRTRSTNAVAKLDGLAEDLMTQVRHPRHGGRRRAWRKDRVRQGLRRQRRPHVAKRWTRTRCFSWPRCPNLWRRRSSRIRSGSTRSAGTPRSCPSCRGSRCRIRPSPRWSMSATCSRTAPGCPITPATCSRIWVTTAGMCSSGCASCRWTRSGSRTPTRTLGSPPGAEAVAVERGQVVGGPRRRGAVRPARHGVDELSVRRLRGAAEPRDRPHLRRRPLRAALHPRRGPRSACGRSQLVGQRHDPLAGHGARQRQL